MKKLLATGALVAGFACSPAYGEPSVDPDEVVCTPVEGIPYENCKRADGEPFRCISDMSKKYTLPSEFAAEHDMVILTRLFKSDGTPIYVLATPDQSRGMAVSYDRQLDTACVDFVTRKIEAEEKDEDL